MDRLPYEFRERVAHLWRFCESHTHKLCACQPVPDCEWTRKSKKERVNFNIGFGKDGEWRHCFDHFDNLDADILSMRELQTCSNLQNIRVGIIFVAEQSPEDNNSRLWSQEAMKREDMERLMKFVTFLSDEPLLWLYTGSATEFDSPVGAILLKHLLKMTFSRIILFAYFPVYNAILENQFSRRKPTNIKLSCQDLGQSAAFFEEHLANGNIKKLYVMYERFPTKVMEGIITSFIQNPQNYAKDQFSIEASFDSAEKFLERALRAGRCRNEIVNYRSVYSFPVYGMNLRICVTSLGEDKYSITIAFNENTEL